MVFKGQTFDNANAACLERAEKSVEQNICAHDATPLPTTSYQQVQTNNLPRENFEKEFTCIEWVKNV